MLLSMVWKAKKFKITRLVSHNARTAKKARITRIIRIAIGVRMGERLRSLGRSRLL